MSKIYEALMRAEQERREAAGREPANAPSAATLDPEPRDIPVAEDAEAPTEQHELHANRFGSEFTGLPAAALRSTSGSFPVAIPSAVGEASRLPVERLDLSQVRTEVWNPMLDKLPALGDRGSSVEQFRSLRSRLFELRDQNPLSSILVSSGLPREGKSFTAINLAISFSRHKASRVLLIDGDMRRGTLHQMLGCDNKPGLTGYLAGEASITQVMQRPRPHADGASLPAGLATLTFIPAGEESDEAADLAGHARFGALVEAAAPLFDWIIVDSSPVNLVTDGLNLARACDGVLLVVRAGVTRFESLQRALGELKAAKVLGVVLNAVENAPAGGYYGYDSYDSYDANKTK